MLRVLIGLFDADDIHHRSAREALEAAQNRGDALLVPASVLAECLVRPSRIGPTAVELVRSLVTRLPIEVAALDERTAVIAAAVRARDLALKLPDAFVVATAIAADADVLLTTDRRWPGAEALVMRLV